MIVHSIETDDNSKLSLFTINSVSSLAQRYRVVGKVGGDRCNGVIISITFVQVKPHTQSQAFTPKEKNLGNKI